MIQTEKLMPPTSEGMQTAIDSTPIGGYWEDRVDWWRDTSPEDSSEINEKRVVIMALATAIVTMPELFTEEDRTKINSDMAAIGIRAVISAKASYGGGPEVVLTHSIDINELRHNQPA